MTTSPAFRSLLRAATSASILLLAGCVSVGPDYHAPAQPPVVLHGAAAPVYSAQSPVAGWWAQFDDPVLGQLVHAALSDNLDLALTQKKNLWQVCQANLVKVLWIMCCMMPMANPLP